MRDLFGDFRFTQCWLLALFLTACNSPHNSDKQLSANFWDNCEIDLRKSEQILAADKSDAGQMDYALFLYVFEDANKQRNLKIKEITDELIAKAKTKDPAGIKLLNGGKTSFDGSDDSMIKILMIVSGSQVANTHSAFYAIPCIVVKKRPRLLEATESYFGSNRDNFLPRCGLDYGRGTVPTFPKTAVDGYREALAQLSQPQEGSIRFAIWHHLNSIYAKIIFNPIDLIRIQPTIDEYTQKILDTPKCKMAFIKAESELVKYFKNNFGFDEAKSKSMARHVLLLLVPSQWSISENRGEENAGSI
jgi:hypothetical protein